MINQISKVFDGRIATKMKNIYLKKDKQLNKQKEVLNKIKDKINQLKKEHNKNNEIALDKLVYNTLELNEILELLEEIE